MADQPSVVSTHYPFLYVRVEVRGWSDEAFALLDTGFTGEAIVPESIFGQDIGLPDEHTDVEVGGGRIVNAPVYLGILEIFGLLPVLDVAATVLGDELIIGTGVLDRYEVILDHGSRVIIKP